MKEYMGPEELETALRIAYVQCPVARRLPKLEKWVRSSQGGLIMAGQCWQIMRHCSSPVKFTLALEILIVLWALNNYSVDDDLKIWLNAEIDLERSYAFLKKLVCSIMHCLESQETTLTLSCSSFMRLC